MIRPSYILVWFPENFMKVREGAETFKSFLPSTNTKMLCFKTNAHKKLRIIINQILIARDLSRPNTLQRIAKSPNIF